MTCREISQVEAGLDDRFVVDEMVCERGPDCCSVKPAPIGYFLDADDKLRFNYAYEAPSGKLVCEDCAVEIDDNDGEEPATLHHFNVVCRVVGLIWARSESDAEERFGYSVTQAVGGMGFSRHDDPPPHAFHSETCNCTVAGCDLCGRIEPHDHTDDEYGTYYPTGKDHDVPTT